MTSEARTAPRESMAREARLEAALRRILDCEWMISNSWGSPESWAKREAAIAEATALLSEIAEQANERRSMSANADFDGMLWPLPDSDLAWKARYGKPTQAEMYLIASRLEAYAHLLELPQKRRNYICKKIKESAR